MADITIPPPNADGWHFTYITTDPLTGEWYGGKRSCKKHPLSDPYTGSGNWVRSHPARDRLRRAIVAFYATSTEVFAAEAELITSFIVMDDPLCMNECEGGKGMTPEFALVRNSKPEYKKKHQAAVEKRSADPTWQKKNAAILKRRSEDPAFRTKIAESMQDVYETDKFRQAASSGSLKRSASKEWQTNHAAGMARRSERPEWKAACAVINERTRSDPLWLENTRAGSAKQWSKPGRREQHLAQNRNPKMLAALQAGARNRSPESRAAALKKAWITRRAKAAAKT